MSDYSFLKDFLNVSGLVNKKLDLLFADEFDSHIYPMILLYIYETKIKVYQKDIEKEFSIKKSTLCDFLNYLEKNNYISKEISKNDSRYKEIHLTNNSIEKIKTYKKILKKFNNNLKITFSNEDFKSLENYMLRINQVCKN